MADTELTLKYADLADHNLSVPDPLLAETEEEKQIIEDAERDAALMAEWLGDDADEEEVRPWVEAPPFPRYQIQVTLMDDRDVP